MRSLFLAMIPSIMATAGVTAKEAGSQDSSAKALMDVVEKYVLFVLNVDANTSTWLALPFLFFAIVIFVVIGLLYRKGTLRRLDSSFATFFTTLTLGLFIVLVTSVKEHLSNYDALLMLAIVALFLAFCLLVVAVNIQILQWVLASLLGALERMEHPIRQSKRFTSHFARFFSYLKKFFAFRLINKRKKELGEKTLYFASKALTAMLDLSWAGSDAANHDDPMAPEFQFIISGDTKLLEKMPSSPPYDLLHFIEIQCIWAKEFNNKIEQAKRPTQYYVTCDDNGSGALLDKIVCNSIKQWEKRIPNNFHTKSTIPITRAVRILFSSEKDLDDSAIKVAQTSEITLPLSKDEIRNVWIPIDDILLFCFVDDWAKNQNVNKWQEKFLPPPTVLSETNECCTPAQVIDSYVKWLKRQYRDENIDNPFDLISQELYKASDRNKIKEKFMYLFVGNRMDKRGYHEEDPYLYSTLSARLRASANHLAHLSLVLMALHHKEALPLLKIFEKVSEERREKHEKPFNKKAKYYTRRCIKSVQEAMKRKLEEAPQ